MVEVVTGAAGVVSELLGALYTGAAGLVEVETGAAGLELLGAL